MNVSDHVQLDGIAAREKESVEKNIRRKAHTKSMHMSSGAMFIDNGCQCRETVFVGRTTLRLLERDRKKVGDKASRRQNERTFGSADEYVLCVSDAIVPCHDVCFIDPN